ncbi:MAG: HAD family hydrolase [Nanobdellota archaeon]
MERLKAIIFDLGGVIFSSDGGSYEGREKIAKKIDLDRGKFHELWFKNKEYLVSGKMSEEEFLEEIIKLSQNKISITYLKKLFREGNKINQDMLNLIQKLNKKYILGILNNEVKEWNEYRIKKFKLKDYFKIIISSCDVGAAKPDSKIYEILLKKLDMHPDEVIFIDNRIENLSPAEKMGIKTHLFEGKEDLVKWFNNVGIVI